MNNVATESYILAVFHCIVNTTVIRLVYSSILNTTSRTYSPTGCSVPNHYYEALQLGIMVTGYYRLSSNSNIGLHGYIYLSASFDPFNPSQLLSAAKDGELGFQLVTLFEANKTYVLVVTSATPNQTGSFSVVATGPSNISAHCIGNFECFHIIP